METTQLNSPDNCFSASYTVITSTSTTALTIQHLAGMTKKVRFLWLITTGSANIANIILERIVSAATTTLGSIVNVNANNPLAAVSVCQSYTASNAATGTQLLSVNATAANTTSLDISFIDLESSVLDGITVRIPSSSATITITLIWREF